ncbi:MAG: hypothetical protein J0L84_06170 [Verrucomicrobia bacterium]|nr:hypothetical protein [Verrucomicrobiota bacterium]
MHYRTATAGNRKPYAVRYFEKKGQAEDFAGSLEGERRDLGSVWVDLPASERAVLVEAHELARKSGVSLVDAVRRAAEAPGGTMTLGELRDDVLSAKRIRGLRPRSINALRLTLSAFCASREALGAHLVTAAMIREWVESRGWSAVRRSVALQELSTMFQHGLRTGAVQRNPCDAIERPIIEAKPTSILTPDQTRNLFRVCEQQDPELLGFLALAAFGGFRTESEVGRMSRADVEAALQAGVVRPPVENKTRRQRLVPVLPCLRAWLARWLPLGADVIPPNFRKRWRVIFRAAGIHPWPQNVLRHSRASYRLAETGDERLTAAEDGHTPDVLVRHYRALVTPEAAREYFAIIPKDHHP